MEKLKRSAGADGRLKAGAAASCPDRHQQAGEHNRRGIVFAQQGKHAEALEEFRRAIALWPDDPEAHYNLGLTLENLGETALSPP